MMRAMCRCTRDAGLAATDEAMLASVGFVSLSGYLHPESVDSQHTVTPPLDDSKHWPASSAGWMQAHVGFETHCAGIGAHPSAGGHAPWLIRSQICVVGSQ